MTHPVRVAAAVVLGLAAYAVVAVYLLHLAWPYPTVLPSSFDFHGNTYHQDSSCRSLAAINRHNPRLHRVGSLPSALWIGDRAIYGPKINPTSHTYDYVVVQANGCYRFYQGDRQL